jgi:DNA-binding response OmpR family regulator
LLVLDAHPGSIDLLITDVVMPGTSGYVLSEQVKRRRPEIRVLFMSGFVVVPAHYGLSGEDRGLEPGAAILAKPFTGSHLHEKVREVLGAAGAVRTPPREPALGAWPSKRSSRPA